MRRNAESLTRKRTKIISYDSNKMDTGKCTKVFNLVFSVSSMLPSFFNVWNPSKQIVELRCI